MYNKISRHGFAEKLLPLCFIWRIEIGEWKYLIKGQTVADSEIVVVSKISFTDN